MGGNVNLIDQDGTTISVPVEQAASLLSRGYRQEQASDETARNVQSYKESRYGGPGGQVVAFGAGALRGATLGLSDMGLSALGGGDDLAGLQDAHPYTSMAGQVVGELLPAMATGGESLAAEGILEGLPAARLGRFATSVGDLVPGTGALSRIGRLAATGATEGAISNAGQYLGQAALADKPISAEAFLASMSDGALYGGATAGALGISGEGMIAARRLLPEAELSPIAARRARAAAVQEVSRAVDDSGGLVEAGRAKARQIREEAVARNPELRAELDKIALQKTRDLAEAQTGAARARQVKLEADAAAAQSRAEAAAVRTERVKNPAKRGKAIAPEVDEAVAPTVETSTPTVGPSDLNTELGKQLQATKQALDAGKSLAQLSTRRKETFVEDALNAHVAKSDPDMDRLLRHLDGLTDAREQVATWLDKHPDGKVRGFEYTEGMRKRDGFAEVVPEGEGNALKPRGRQFELRGGESDRLAFEGKVARGDLHRIVDDPLAGVEERAAATRALSLEGDEQAKALADLQALRGNRLDAKATAKQIVGASESEHAPSLDEHMDRALNGHADLHEEVDDATHAIGSLEQKSADLADELGHEAPPSAQQRASAYRQVQADADASHASATQSAIADADKAAKTIGLGKAPARAKGLLDKAKSAADMLEALQFLGVDVPSAKDIPVVGPLLSMYLRARLAMRAAGRHGGKVFKTAETEIARRSAQTRTRLMQAADRTLAGAARVVSSPKAAVASAVLATTLFDDRDPRTRERKTKQSDDIQDLYLARRDEIMRSQSPGAIREALRKRVRTMDAGMLDELEATESRKLKFLYDKMPQVAGGLSLFEERSVKAPARSDLEKWSKFVAAANRPIETMEAILDGSLVSSEAAETLRTVYPRLVQDVQQRLVEKAVESPVRMPFKKRNRLSIMLGLPLDDSQSPESAQFMSQMYQRNTARLQSPPAPSMFVDSRSAERVDPETKI